MALHLVLVLFYTSFIFLKQDSVNALTADVVFDVLSRRIDYVIQKVYAVNSEVTGIKEAVKKIEERIESMETNVTELMKEADNIYDGVHGIRRPLSTDSIERQSKALQKAFMIEKAVLRTTVDQLQNMFSEMQSEIKSQFSLMNSSVENSLEYLEETASLQKNDTKASLQEMKMELEATTNETLHKMEEIGQEITGQSLSKISETEEIFLTQVKSDVKNAKQELIAQLSTEVIKMTTKLSALERAQENQEDKFDGLISDLDRRISSEESYTSGLSRRISDEEARKVAFSAYLNKKRSYYGKKEKIVFNSVLYSHGGGYDSTTGIFTAPKSGTYLFTYNVESKESGYAHVFLNVRGYGKTRALAGKGWAINGGNAGVEYLWKGDQAWIETAHLEDKYYIFPYRTTFNGILID